MFKHVHAYQDSDTNISLGELKDYVMIKYNSMVKQKTLNLEELMESKLVVLLTKFEQAHKPSSNSRNSGRSKNSSKNGRTKLNIKK